jgi:acyl-CoA thioester hydrolase
LLVVSIVEAVRGASVIIAQRILRGQDTLTEGRVTAAFLSPEGRPRRQPAGWADRFTAIMNGETNPC